MADYTPENINLFKDKTLNDTIVKQDLHIIHPVTSLETNNEIIEFRFDTRNQHNKYVDLSSLELDMVVQITKSDGTLLTQDTGDYAVVSNLLHSMISNLELSVNQTLVDQIWSYPYISFYHTMFNETKSEELLKISQMFTKDSVNFNALVSKVVQGTTSNLGAIARWDMVKNSNNYHMRSKLYTNASSLDHLLLPNTEINVKLRRNADAFSLMCANDNFKINIKSIKLLVTSIQLNESVASAHNEILRKANAKYNFTEYSLQTHVLNSGQKSFDINNVFTKEQDSVLIWMVDTDGMNGSLKKNPYFFIHENATEISLQQGEHLYKYSLDFENKNVLTAYDALIKRYPALNISLDEFINGYTFIYFPLRPIGSFKNIEKRSSVDLHIDFNDHLKKNVTLFILSPVCKQFQIDKSRNVIVNHA